MKAKIIHILCEGQTEQGFVEEVLRPYLQHSIQVVKKAVINYPKTYRKLAIPNSLTIVLQLRQANESSRQ